jgi:hypothetical protein
MGILDLNRTVESDQGDVTTTAELFHLGLAMIISHVVHLRRIKPSIYHPVCRVERNGRQVIFHGVADIANLAVSLIEARRGWGSPEPSKKFLEPFGLRRVLLIHRDPSTHLTIDPIMTRV